MKQLPQNAQEVMVRRYAVRNEKGLPAETPAEILERTARVVAEAENNYRDGITPKQVEEKFANMLKDFRFVPNGRTLANAGTGQGQLANCFVLPLEDELGRTGDGIFSILRKAVLVLQSGGGVGFSFGRIRPRGDTAGRGKATGPVSFLKVFDTAFWIIGQGGGRRSACMAVLPVHHPDIYDFIHSKEQEGVIEHFNISVGITDEFMRAVEKDGDFALRNPRTNKPWKTVRATDLFNEIVRFAHHNGEPGVLFLDAANRQNPVPHQYVLEATNPCFIGSTRIPTNLGLLRIEELARIAIPLQIAVDGRTSGDLNQLGTQHTESSKVFLTAKNKKVYELVTRKGYKVTVTANHRFFTSAGEYIAAETLKIGDVICLQSGEGIWSKEYQLPNSALFDFQSQRALLGGSVATLLSQRYAHMPSRWTYELGLVLGWLVGDGWLTSKSNSPLGFSFGKDSQGVEGLELVLGYMKQWFTKGSLAERSRSWQLTFGKTPAAFFRTLGIKEVKATSKRVPEAVFSAPREVVAGFLRGLFSADGTVQISPEKQYCSVRLASSSKQLLEEVQLLLLNFGIVSALLLRRSARNKLMPSSDGTFRTYATSNEYELIIGKESRNAFAEVIGFATKGKQNKLVKYLKGMKRHAYKESFTDRIVSLKPAGTADVYDLTEPKTHSLIGSGFVTHNCGEQFLGPYENCCMASINLAEHVSKLPGGGKHKNGAASKNGNQKVFDSKIDWNKLQETVSWTVRWLDDVVDSNAYVPAVPELEDAAQRNRRIGVSLMGLADLMYLIGVRYGSAEAVDLSGQVMEFIRFHAMKMSIQLAKERGAFPGIVGSIYDYNRPAQAPGDNWKVPQPIKPYTHDFGREDLDWKGLLKDLKQYGIRNSCQTTIQPTGAIATVSGLEGYGCEPVFALSYVMKTHEGAEDKGDGNWAELYYESKLFKQALEKAGMDPKSRDTVFLAVRSRGSCQEVQLVPKVIRDVFVVSGDVKVEEHVAMQAALQAFVDNAISKTINFPEGATEAEVAKAYLTGWKMGLKGMTVYVTGSRKMVVLETQETKDKAENSKDKEELFTDNGNGIIGKPLHKVHPQDLTCAECGAAMVLQEGCATCPQCGSTHCSI